jgi:hypothetical protein
MIRSPLPGYILELIRSPGPSTEEQSGQLLWFALRLASLARDLDAKLPSVAAITMAAAMMAAIRISIGSTILAWACIR